MKTFLVLVLILVVSGSAFAQSERLPYSPNGGCPRDWVAGAAILQGPDGWYMTSRTQTGVEVTFEYLDGDITWKYDEDAYEACIVTEYGATFDWSGDRPLGVERIYIYELDAPVVEQTPEMEPVSTPMPDQRTPGPHR